MLSLRDIMTSDVITLSPELSLRDAMALFSSRHVSGAPVVAGGKVLGVITSTDLMDFVATLPGSPTYREDQTEGGGWEQPSAGNDEGEDAGVEGGEPPAVYFTELWDDAGADVAERIGTPSSPEWNVLDEHTVSEAMTTAISSLPPDTEVSAGAEYMERAGVHRVLVMRDSELLGIVTTSDVTRAVAERKLHDRHYAFGKPESRDEVPPF
jgi:CBS domain-containing protein